MQESALDAAVLDEPPALGAVTPVVPVTPLDYTQLRLLAEYTAVLEKGVDFVLTPEHTLVVTPAPTDDDMLIPARESGRFPPLAVDLYATGEGLAEPLRLDARCADALFWSDAAVQKFLVPYVASCAGDGAAHALARLRAAWTEFDPNLVRVYALAHVVDYRDGARLSLEHAIQVVYTPAPDPYADGRGLQLLRLPLNTFLNTYPPAPGAAHVSSHDDGGAPFHVKYYRGMDASRYQRPDYRTLRAAAEYACSLCHDPMYFTFRERETGFRAEQGLPTLDAGDFMVPVLTPSVPVQRPSLNRVTCTLGGNPPEPVDRAADALFWSDAAVAQFMYPYYASKCGLHEGPAELYWLSRTWTGRFPDLAHVKSPVLPPDPAPRCRDEAGTMIVEGEVMGLVHFPTSEWMPERETATVPSVLREVGVMISEGSGTRMVPPGHFMERCLVRD